MHDTVPEYPISDICLLVINFFFLLEKCFLMEQCWQKDIFKSVTLRFVR